MTRHDIVLGTAFASGVNGRIRRIIRDDLGLCRLVWPGDHVERVFESAPAVEWRRFLDAVDREAEAFDWRFGIHPAGGVRSMLSWAGIRHRSSHLVLAALTSEDLVSFCGARTDIYAAEAVALRALLLAQVPAATRTQRV